MRVRRVPFPAACRSSVAALVCVGMLLCFESFNLASAHADVGRSNKIPLDSANSGQVIALLRTAHARLSTGDHDYKGHRVKALKAVEAAGELLGVNLRDGGDAHETQPASDDQLKAAGANIEQAEELAKDANEPKVVEHLKKAIKEIEAALAVK